MVAEFFRVLQPAHIDALDKVSEKQTAHHREQLKHLRQEVTRLEYAATRAERQYNHVDPENRLIAATLEKKWEQALEELEQARSQLAEAQEAPGTPIKIPAALREAFADVGRRLPDLWPRLSPEAKKSLLRTLVERVSVLRDADGVAQIRIVWRGRLVTELRVHVPVHSLRHSETEKRIAERIRQLTAAGTSHEQTVATLNEEGMVPCRGGSFTAQIVSKLKHRYGIVSNLERLRRNHTLATAYTIRQMAQIVRIDPSWFYRKIRRGALRIQKDATYGCYLFPRNKQTIDQLKQLKKGAVAHASIQKEHHDG